MMREDGDLVWEWAFKPGDFARVVVKEETGNITTAYTKGSRGRSARWAACAKAR
jgi:hypothetical protein